MSSHLKVAARTSPLSRKQIEEVYREIKPFHPHLIFQEVLIESQGDLDRTTSLRTLGQTDFFTKEIDLLVLSGQCDIAIHSAKDLPVPLPDGLELIALTKGLDSSDSLVMKQSTLPFKGIVATSSLRREESVRELYPEAQFVDIRGTISERLHRLESGEVDGVVIAEAALIRLGLTHLPRQRLKGPTAPLQGKLAIIALQENLAMKQLFACIHTHEKNSLPRA